MSLRISLYCRHDYRLNCTIANSVHGQKSHSEKFLKCSFKFRENTKPKCFKIIDVAKRSNLFQFITNKPKWNNPEQLHPSFRYRLYHCSLDSYCYPAEGWHLMTPYILAGRIWVNSILGRKKPSVWNLWLEQIKLHSVSSITFPIFSLFSVT